MEACLATFIVAVLGKLVGHLLCKLTDMLMEHHSNRNKRMPKKQQKEPRGVAFLGVFFAE